MTAYGLVLDLSHAGFAAVLDESGSRVLARSARPAGTRHDDVADWTETLLHEAGGTFDALAWIAVGVGPGSFTGIRIAMAFAQGLALPRGLPLHGFTSFEALHLSARSQATPHATGQPEASDTDPDDARSVLAVVPANAGRFYVARTLADSGALVSGEDLGAMCVGPRVIATPGITPSLMSLSARMKAGADRDAVVWAPGDAWDAVAIARRARASGRGLVRPVYLQLSAAEEKFGAADGGADVIARAPAAEDATP